MQVNLLLAWVGLGGRPVQLHQSGKAGLGVRGSWCEKTGSTGLEGEGVWEGCR